MICLIAWCYIGATNIQFVMVPISVANFLKILHYNKLVVGFRLLAIIINITMVFTKLTQTQ